MVRSACYLHHAITLVPLLRFKDHRSFSVAVIADITPVLSLLLNLLYISADARLHCDRPEADRPRFSHDLASFTARGSWRSFFFLRILLINNPIFCCNCFRFAQNKRANFKWETLVNEEEASSFRMCSQTNQLSMIFLLLKRYREQVESFAFVLGNCK